MPTRLLQVTLASLDSSDCKYFLSYSLILRYEAATIMKNMCLKELALGDVLQILHLVINAKKWITQHPSGWQPVNINVPESSPDWWD